MALPQPIPPKPPWYSKPTAIVSLPTAVPNCTSLIESPTDTPATENWKNKIKNNNNDRPDDDNDDDDVDCFPRQDKQPVLPQDISLTAPTTDNTDNTSPSLLKSTDPTNTDNNNNIQRTTPARRKQTAHRRTKPTHTHTVVPKAPLLVWDGTQYQVDYNHNHRPISTWDGTTHTDIVYDDDEDYNGTNDYAYGYPFNMNDSSNQLQFTQSLKTVQFRRYLQAVQHIDTATKHTQAVPQQKQPSKHTPTTPTHTHEDPKPYMYDTLQLSFLTTHYESADNYTDAFPLYTVPHYITRKKNPSHDNYLYRRWNNPTVRKHKTTKTRKTNKRIPVTAKDDTSVASTLKTLSTIDTRSSHPTNIDTDTILSITIWNQPILQYQLPI
jgi:hypothetical protein